MVTNKMRPIHPGEILREEFLVPMEMSANALAMELHVPAPRINDVVRERRGITPDTALRLFGKPEVSGQRRMGVALARADDVAAARAKATRAAAEVEIEL